MLKDEEEKLKKRAERFKITSESEILKKRAERFKNELDQPSLTSEKGLQKKNKATRRNRKVKRWRRNPDINQKNLRDRRGPKRSLGFKKFGKRNTMRKRRNLRNKRITDN
jgi:hypothetical protein